MITYFLALVSLELITYTTKVPIVSRYLNQVSNGLRHGLNNKTSQLFQSRLLNVVKIKLDCNFLGNFGESVNLVKLIFA